MVEKILTSPRPRRSSVYLEAVANLPTDEENLKPLFKQGLEQFGVKMGDLIHPPWPDETNVSPGI